MELEGLTMNEYARRFLSDGDNDISLPKQLNDALQNVFTKVRDGEHTDKNKFRKNIIKVEKIFGSPNKYTVYSSNKNAIYNALCLLYLVGTGATKKIFQHYDATISKPEKRNFSILSKQSEQQYLEFFCLGIVRENIDEIITYLLSKEFDLFTGQLPSPFSCNSKNAYDLSPMLSLYEKKIPWKDYMDSYEKAEQFYTSKDFSKAKEELKSLEENAFLRLPVVESLNKKIKAQEEESKEAWDYLQKILN